ncbi:hypothetical protein [Rhizobium sp. CCGE 510]|uniref:hypothetical protein n=1 Tax=Rhizobium sp. CCGE 510 TaxID=1132836 RepID=UPI00027B8B59|nr:hypothetical protein [Rhizobium sp. CCGE 510]EJT01437.1 hypothetical protein RCCGE510_29341 [Rhizobium sp. CCGE 510]
MEPTPVLAMRTERTTLMNSDRLPPHKERFQNYCYRLYSRLLDHEALLVRELGAYEGQGDLLRDERYFFRVLSLHGKTRLFTGRLSKVWRKFRGFARAVGLDEEF